MSIDFQALEDAPRLLIEVPLRPVQGSRFQPTGFPDLGAATFAGVRLNDDGAAEQVDCLLVESAQSMANRLEAVCWDEAADNLVAPLRGLPFVRSTLPDGTVTDSIREAHRLNSPYIVRSREFAAIKEEIGFEANKPFDRKRLARTLLKFDPCSLLHGIFLEKVGGVVRLPRIVSAFVEAEGVSVAAAGGVKLDRVQPATGEGDEKPQYGKAEEGYGNVPYHRDEYTAEKITAFFNVDLAQLRGYGLGQPAEQLLVAVVLFKIRKFLLEGLRLRTACDLEPTNDIVVQRPSRFVIPDVEVLARELPKLVKAASGSFAAAVITDVTYDKSAK